MIHKLYKQNGADLIDISNFVGNVSRRSTRGEISEELTFKMPNNEILVIDNPILEGDIVYLKSDDVVIFKGIVVSRSMQAREEMVITCYDFGWYLNKNENIYQFNASISDNITRILSEYGIKIGYIETIPTFLKDTKRGTLSSIIKEMIEFGEKDQGIKYRWEMREDSFYLEPIDYNPVTYTTSQIADNEDVLKYIGQPNHKTSIEGMYNAVFVAGESKNKVISLSYQEDTDSIDKYGKLQKLEYIDKNDYPKATNIATNQLKTLNKLQHDISIKLLGNDSCRANRVLKLTEPITGMDGDFIIKQCTHNIDNVYTMDLTLEVI